MYSYFLILGLSLLSVIVTIIFTRNKYNYLSEFKFISLSTFATAIPFLIWDEMFTSNSVWGFTREYITGIKLGNLPIEEVSFFFAIPWCSLFIYHICKYTVSKRNILDNKFYLFVGIIGVGLILFSISHSEKIYTLTSIFLAGIVLIFNSIFKFRNLKTFLVSYFIILLPFLIVNGILTYGIPWISDDPIVWYDNTENLNFRILSIPIEDSIYGFSLLLINVNIYEFIRHIVETKRAST